MLIEVLIPVALVLAALFGGLLLSRQFGKGKDDEGIHPR